MNKHDATSSSAFYCAGHTRCTEQCGMCEEIGPKRAAELSSPQSEIAEKTEGQLLAEAHGHPSAGSPPSAASLKKVHTCPSCGYPHDPND